VDVLLKECTTTFVLGIAARERNVKAGHTSAKPP